MNGRGTAAAASSAEGAAALRAAAASERERDIRGPDHLAGRLVSNAPRLTLLAKLPLIRRIGPRVAEWILPGSYWFELARTKRMDEVLQHELATGLEQLVILGAGFDTRAYRYADQLGDVATFEVDHPATASLKRHRLRRLFGALPSHVRYVDLDLNLGDIAGTLQRAGYRQELRTLVIWSGVTAYLQPRSVDAAFAWLATSAPPGSSIVFDYCFQDMVAGDDSYFGAPQLRRRLARGGEPLVFGIDPGRLPFFLSERGFRLISETSPDELERRFLVRGDGRRAGRVYGFAGIAHARVVLDRGRLLSGDRLLELTQSVTQGASGGG